MAETSEKRKKRLNEAAKDADARAAQYAAEAAAHEKKGESDKATVARGRSSSARNEATNLRNAI